MTQEKHASQERLDQVGTALAGSAWLSTVARDVGLTKGTLCNYRQGAKPVPLSLWPRLGAVALSRAAKMRELAPLLGEEGTLLSPSTGEHIERAGELLYGVKWKRPLAEDLTGLEPALGLSETPWRWTGSPSPGGAPTRVLERALGYMARGEQGAPAMLWSPLRSLLMSRAAHLETLAKSML